MTVTRRSALGLLGAIPLTATVSAIPAAGSASGGPVPPGLKPGGELDRFVAERAAVDEFSGTLLLQRNGKTVLSRSYGMANKERSVPTGPHTIFATASLTKLFTAVAIAQLAERGAVRYTDAVGAHVDGLRAEIADRVTVHHLLTHTSGLGDHHALPGFWETALTWTSVEDVMDGTMGFIRQLPAPRLPPGAAQVYSNAGYHLLGEIVARSSAQPYHDYVREHVFAPAGMTSTDFYTTTDWRSDRRIARPYLKNDAGEWVDAIAQHVFVGSPAGGAFSTCPDLARFARAVMGDDLLDPAFRDLMLGAKVPLPRNERSPAADQQPGASPPRLGYQAYGPIAGLAAGEWSFGIGGGSTHGASASIESYPVSGWTWTILSNYQEGATEPITSLAKQLISTG